MLPTAALQYSKVFYSMASLRNAYYRYTEKNEELNIITGRVAWDNTNKAFRVQKPQEWVKLVQDSMINTLRILILRVHKQALRTFFLQIIDPIYGGCLNRCNFFFNFEAKAEGPSIATAKRKPKILPLRFNVVWPGKARKCNYCNTQLGVYCLKKLFGHLSRFSAWCALFWSYLATKWSQREMIISKSFIFKI